MESWFQVFQDLEEQRRFENGARLALREGYGAIRIETFNPEDTIRCRNYVRAGGWMGPILVIQQFGEIPGEESQDAGNDQLKSGDSDSERERNEEREQS